MRKSAIPLFPVLVALAGCCSPDSCRPARLGIRQLEPIIERIVSYQQTEGHFPDNLEEAFPEGLPRELTRLPNLPTNNYSLDSNNGSVIIFAYGDLSKSGFVTTAESADGAFEAHRYITFRYTGPGQNTCVWTTMELIWNCWGYM